jgi:hypothetical protein
MAMPSGESPQHAKEFYEYLLAHHQTERPVKTWYIEWLSLAWLWGFLAALAVILILWVWQYRTTRQRPGIYAADTWSGFTSELAGPATTFFILLTGILVGFAVAIVVGHIVNGQIF